MDEDDNVPSTTALSFSSELPDGETIAKEEERERQILKSVLQGGKDQLDSSSTGSIAEPSDKRASFFMQMLRARLENPTSPVKKASKVSHDQELSSPPLEQMAMESMLENSGLVNGQSEQHVEEHKSGRHEAMEESEPAVTDLPAEHEAVEQSELPAEEALVHGGLRVIAPVEIKQEVMSDDEVNAKVGHRAQFEDDSSQAALGNSDNVPKSETQTAEAESECINAPLRCANCLQEFFTMHEAQVHSISCTMPCPEEFGTGMIPKGRIDQEHGHGGVLSASQSLSSLNESYIRDNLEKRLLAAAGEELVLKTTDVAGKDSNKKTNKDRTKRRKGRSIPQSALARAKESSELLGSAEEEEMTFSCLLCNFNTTKLFDLGKHVNDMHGSRAPIRKHQMPAKSKTSTSKKMYKVCVVCGMDTQDFVLFHKSESSHSLSSRLGRLLKQKVCMNDVGSRYLCQRCVKRIETYEEAMVIQFQMKTQFENTRSLLEGKLSRNTGDDSDAEYVELPVNQAKVKYVEEDTFEDELINEGEEQQDEYIPSAESDGSWTPSGTKHRKKRKRKISNKEAPKKQSGCYSVENGGREQQSIDLGTSRESGSRTLRGLLSGPLPRPSPPPVSTVGSRLQAMLTARPSNPSMMRGFTGVSGKAAVQPSYASPVSSGLLANKPTQISSTSGPSSFNLQAALADALATAPGPKATPAFSGTPMPHLLDALSGKSNSSAPSILGTIQSITSLTKAPANSSMAGKGSASTSLATALLQKVSNLKVEKNETPSKADKFVIKTEPLNEDSQSLESEKNFKEVQKHDHDEKLLTSFKLEKSLDAEGDETVRRSGRKRRVTKKAREGGVPSPKDGVTQGQGGSPDKVSIDQIVSEAKHSQEDPPPVPSFDINELLNLARKAKESEPVGMPGYAVEEGEIRNFPGAVASYRIKPQTGGLLSEYICTQCNIVFYSEPGIQAHIQCHVAGSRELTCYLCQFHHDLLPTQWRIMKTHLVQNHKMDPDMFSRSRNPMPMELTMYNPQALASKPFESFSQVNAMVRNMFPSVKEVRHKLDSQGKFEFTCQHCSTALYSAEARDLHMHCHVNKGKCFICPLCSYQHPSQPGSWRFMRGHIWKAHVPKPLPSTVFNQYECQRYACRLKFANSCGRSVHESCHDNLQDGQFFCYICGYRAPQGPFCWEPIRDHVILKHPDVLEGPYMCICGLQFDEMEMFLAHIKEMS